MLVRKKNSEWAPSENPFLKVGETIEITDPKALIMSGMVTGLEKDGVTELSAYELYGEIVGDELEEYKTYLKTKKLENQKVLLERQQKELEAKIANKPKAEAKVEEQSEGEEDLEKLAYRDLQKKAAAAGLENVVGVSKADLIKAIQEKK